MVFTGSDRVYFGFSRHLSTCPSVGFLARSCLPLRSDEERDKNHVNIFETICLSGWYCVDADRALVFDDQPAFLHVNGQQNACMCRDSVERERAVLTNGKVYRQDVVT